MFPLWKSTFHVANFFDHSRLAFRSEFINTLNIALASNIMKSHGFALHEISFLFLIITSTVYSSSKVYKILASSCW